MHELPKESADNLLEFGKLFKKSLAIQVVVLILSLSTGYIPIVAVYITALVILRIVSISIIIYQILMSIQLYYVKNSYLEKNLPLGFIFFVGMVGFSILDNGLSIIGIFVDNQSLNFVSHLTSTASISLEILFWIFFLRFLVSTEIYLLENLLVHVKILIGVVSVSLAIEILYYFGFLVVLLGWILLLAVLVVGLMRFIYQLKIANGIIDNFEWNH